MTSKAKSAGSPTSAFLRIAGLACFGFAAAIVLANAILVPAGLPGAGAGTAEVVEFFAASGGALVIGSALMPAAWALATLFGAGVVAALWRSEPGWSLFGFAGIVLQNGAFAAVGAIRLALPSAAERGDGVVAGLWALHDALFTLNGVFLAIALVGLSAAGARAAFIPRWHAALGLLSAVLLFSSATLAPLVVEHGGPLGLLGLCGWLMWVVWLAAYGVALLRPALGGARHPAAA